MRVIALLLISGFFYFLLLFQNNFCFCFFAFLLLNPSNILMLTSFAFDVWLLIYVRGKKKTLFLHLRREKMTASAHYACGASWLLIWPSFRWRQSGV